MDTTTRVVVFMLAIAVLGTFIHLFLKSDKSDKKPTDVTQR